MWILSFVIKIWVSSKEICAYIRSKQKLSDKVGSIKHQSDQLLTGGMDIAENLNEHFSSVFTSEYTDAISLIENRFGCKDSEYLGEFIVTPRMVMEKISTLNKSKSSRVDGIPTKCLIHRAQLGIPLMITFNLSLKRSIVRGTFLAN